VKPGIIHLAQWTGHPIIPILYETSPHKELKSWDRFQIPYPFAKCKLSFGKPIFIPPEATEEEISRYCAELAAILGG
jgi:lysophospholipid acyltransferase (LPLAT)-like uncharacterized protein